MRPGTESSRFRPPIGPISMDRRLDGSPAASPAAISNDVVFQAGMDGILHAYATVDGSELWSSNLGASVSGGIGVNGGVVVIGAETPVFAQFIIEGSQVHGFVLSDGSATPVASPQASPIG